MADLIALHWGTDEITVAAPAKGRDVRAVSLGAPPQEDPAAVGRWLKTELAGRRLSAKRVYLVLPRSAAVFRKLALPDVPDDELPDLVRMQAATKCPTPLDRLRLDYVPLPRRGESREALLATIPAKVAEDALAAVRAAGLEPAGIGLSPFGTAARVAAEDASTLIVAVQGASVEITLVRDRAVILSHSTELQGGSVEEDRKWLPGEVTRAVVAADHLAAAGGISRVVLIGPTELLGPLVETFAERYGGRADLIDEAGDLGVTSAEAGVSPAALAAAAGQFDATAVPARLDFLHPRKRVEKPDRRRTQVSVAAAGLVLVAVIGYYLSLQKQGDLEDRIASLRTQSAEIDAALKRGKPTLDAQGKVNEWLGDRVDWVEQFATLDTAMPGTERVYLTKVTLESGTLDAVGRIRGTGLARDRFDVVRLEEELAAKGYRVTPKPNTESRRDPQYPRAFDLDLAIPRAKPAEPAKTSTPPRPTSA